MTTWKVAFVLTERARRWVHGLATIGGVGIGLNVLVLVVVPFLRRDVDVLQDGLSHYAEGPWSDVQEAGFVALALGAAALGGALLFAAESGWTRLGGALLMGAALGFLGLGVFPMGQGGPTTFIGDLHLTAGTIGIVLQFAGLLCVLVHPSVRTGDRLPRRFGLAVAAVAIVAAAMIQLAIWNPTWPIPEGLMIRLVIGPLLVWWAVVAVMLRREPTAISG